MASTREQEIRIAPAPLKGDDCYEIRYSEFGGHVYVMLNRGSIVSVDVIATDRAPVSAGDLRNFPLLAVETLLRNGPNHCPRINVPPIEKPGSRIDERFLTMLSRFYIDALTRNQRPLVAISNALDVPHSTVARWVSTARKERYLK